MTAFELVQKQAEDEGLWFNAETASEAYLQAALRELHHQVELEHAGAGRIVGHTSDGRVVREIFPSPTIAIFDDEGNPHG